MPRRNDSLYSSLWSECARETICSLHRIRASMRYFLSPRPRNFRLQNRPDGASIGRYPVSTYVYGHIIFEYMRFQ